MHGSGSTMTTPSNKSAGEPASVNEIRRLDVAGLAWNAEAARVSGIPTIAGIHKVVVLYTPDGEMDPQPKDVDLTVIDDPKNLWKDIPSNPGVPILEGRQLRARYSERPLCSCRCKQTREKSCPRRDLP